MPHQSHSVSQVLYRTLVKPPTFYSWINLALILINLSHSIQNGLSPRQLVNNGHVDAFKIETLLIRKPEGSSLLDSAHQAVRFKSFHPSVSLRSKNSFWFRCECTQHSEAPLCTKMEASSIVHNVGDGLIFRFRFRSDSRCEFNFRLDQRHLDENCGNVGEMRESKCERTRIFKEMAVQDVRMEPFFSVCLPHKSGNNVSRRHTKRNRSTT